MSGRAGDKGLIFNVQRFSVHDGPGIRDLVFMKGCPLRCRWCSNPESQNPDPEVMFSESRCIGQEECGRCIPACPEAAIAKTDDSKIRVDRKLCTICGKCVEACPAKALRFAGEYVSLDSLLKTVEEDCSFYTRSGGGVTVSGGEPLLQPEFVSRFLKECRSRGIDTAVEITGHARWDDVRELCRHANLVLCDVKHMDAEQHRAFTGVTNQLILENIKRLSSEFPATPLLARTPVIPGFNDSEDDISAIADFLSTLENVKEHELLPYHGFGEPKYRQLGREYTFSGTRALSPERMAALKEIARKVRAG